MGFGLNGMEVGFVESIVGVWGLIVVEISWNTSEWYGGEFDCC